MRPEQGDQPPAQPLPEVAALLQALRQVKESKNLSLDAFTHDTGYSRSSWNRVLKGTAFPPRTAVERLCSRRGLDKNKLLGLWDDADRARHAAAQETETAGTESPETGPAPAPEPSAPDPIPPTVPAPGPGAAAPTPAAVAPAPTPAPAEPSPASPSAAPRPAAPRRRIRTLALIAAVLTALLLVGRWYSAHETQNPVVSQPETGGDNRPSDDQPVNDETPNPVESSTAPDTTPTPSEEKNKDRSKELPGEEETDKSAHPSSSAKGQDTSPAASASASPAVALGAAGRANCRYNWDRTQTMAKGMVGSKVKQIQCLLNNNYDYTLTVDGKFGDSTDTAVRAVQRCSGLKADGQVGPETWKYLDTPMAGCGH